MRDPPLCTLRELQTVYTIDDLADFHEMIDEENFYAEQYEKLRNRK